jgi:hypothetical protein
MLRIRSSVRWLWIAIFGILPISAIAEPSDVPWSLRPLTAPPVPSAAEGTHPVDAFVAAKLSEKGLTRAVEADRRTLIRRLYFGLTGLPPTPEDVQAFLDDADPRAYENLVKQMLASPRYGERWARHWLDVAQYADTHGNDHDYVRRNAWPYRDYVIRSLNDDKPYARFVEEQVAGDVLFPRSPEATVALGFLAAGPWDDTLMITIREDTIDHRMGQNLDRDGMVSAVMGTFQSQTVHCARCHDHKFDPISQREYYALQAVFAGVDRADRPFDEDPKVHRHRSELRERQLAIERRDPEFLAKLDSPEVTALIEVTTKEYLRRTTQWQLLESTGVVSTMAADETVFTKEADDSWFVSGNRPDQDSFVITSQTEQTNIKGIRLEVLPDKRLPNGGPGRYDNGNFHLAGWRVTAAPNTTGSNPVPLEFLGVVADHSDGADAVGNTLDGNPGTWWSVNPRYNQPHEAVFALKEPAGFDGGTKLEISLDFTGKPGHQIGRFRLWVTTQPLGKTGQLPGSFPEDMAKLLDVPENLRTTEQRQELAMKVLEKSVRGELEALPEPSLVYAATHDFKPENSFKPTLHPRPIHRLIRGDLNQPAELVGPGAISCIPDLPATLPISNVADESARRAALARWLTDARNVLTWRSIVNRVWHWHFGRGICDTPNDFGKMGGKPSNPELLDWLAAWFRDEAKGSLKALHRLIVTSATYRQRVIDNPKAGAGQSDSENHLLWRQNRLRLSGEQVRDAALQFSGQLDTSKIGGPPVMHFLHKGDATFKPGGNPPFVDYANFDQNAPENRRRAIYRFLFRTVPDPFMDALACPDGGGPVPVRASTSTAQQALAMLNDAFLIRQAERIAERIAAETAEPNEQIRAAFRLIVQREPTGKERSDFVGYAVRHGLSNASHLLFNSNEFLYLD